MRQELMEEDMDDDEGEQAYDQLTKEQKYEVLQ